jgi:uncharacterized protein YjiS (DUF1127 family)
MRKSIISTVALASLAPVTLPYAAGPAIRHLAIQVVAALVRWRQTHAKRRQHLRAMAELGAFSDLELKDIGVYRSEIQWVVNHGRHATPVSMNRNLGA